MATQTRRLSKILDAKPSADGDGVNIHRIAGRRVNHLLDPYLLLDEIKSDDSKDYSGGFPPHPHRGFQTITYMIHGRLAHQDHLGNEGLLDDGGVQYMTAGKGIIHSEMPKQTNGLMHAFQLWLNLSAAEKMQPPSYRDFQSDHIPVINLDGGGIARVIAGKVKQQGQWVTGPIEQPTTLPTIFDIALEANMTLALSIDPAHTGLVHVYEGATEQLSQDQMGVYEQGSEINIKAGSEGVSLLFLAGKPLKEPIAQHGPFVMNTPEEVDLAIAAMNDGTLTN